MRLDLYLSENGYAQSRNRAQHLIRSGLVLLDGRTVLSPSFEVDINALHRIQVTQDCPYVGRGGLKLEAALDAFGLSPCGAHALDVGASTGGFTDCLLQRGAAHVVAVDSGQSQLHESLRNDERVTSMEGQNARYLRPELLPYAPDFVVMDVSFISQTLLHPVLAGLCAPGAVLVSLIKPQFELTRKELDKHGIVRRQQDRDRAIARVTESAALCGFGQLRVMPSPIAGGDGNLEYLLAGIRDASDG
ncbi:MAG: TlyA family RNA methyltransferase [Clostridia bacterium]|nr:TlyA family RNA methyltransferase [Clostridia bacterium]